MSEQSKNDISNDIVDEQYINDFRVVYFPSYGYDAYNEDGQCVYHIDLDGVAEIKTQNGQVMQFTGLTPDDIAKDAVLINDEGMECTFSGTAITKATYNEGEYGDYGEIIYGDNFYIEREYDQEGGNLCVEMMANNSGSGYFKDVADGTIEYYNENKRVYRTTYANGISEYTIDDGISVNSDGVTIPIKKVILTTYPDGTYIEGDEKGTYTLDKDGNVICINQDGNQVFYNEYGEKYQIIDQKGTVYNIQKNSQKTIKDGRITYSKIGHIEYDEEAYFKVLNTLNGVDGSSIISGCSSIEGDVSSFPDSYPNGGINGIKDSIEGHVNLIKSLSEMTNYSLLAYDTCDEDLRKGLYLLVDSLFGENELALANRFKNDIKSSIEDRDNDNILEYKEGTNFKLIADNTIVSNIYTDSDGNKWYLNKSKRVISLEGDNIKLNYGGETFNVTYDEKGLIRLTDSSGKPLNIFGDYNIESKQFGEDQEELVHAYDNQYVNALLSRYFPEATQEEITNFLRRSANVCCANTAMTDLVFKKFEGKEDEFYQTFGYPMYDIKLGDDGLSVDYNYEPMTLELIYEENKHRIPDNFTNPTIKDLTRYTAGTSMTGVMSMFDYLKEEYGIELTDFPQEYEIHGAYGYTMFNIDGSSPVTSPIAHAVLCLEKVNDNQWIVAQNGEKKLYTPNEYWIMKFK